MSNAASLVYTVPQGGAPALDLETAVSSVPIPTDIFNFLGLRVLSDTTTFGSSSVVRTVDVSLIPATASTAIPALLGSLPTGSPIESIAVGLAGSDFIAPPGVLIGDFAGTGKGAAAKAFLDVGTVNVDNPGSGYGAQTFAVAYGGLPPGNGSPGQTSLTYQKVLRVDMASGGVGYSPKTQVFFVGGLTPRGRAAKGSVQLVGGAVAGVVVTDEGDEYLTAPQVFIFDPVGDGFGATATAYMVPGKKVTFQGRPATVSIAIAGGMVSSPVGLPDSGEGYISPPQILIVDPSFSGSGAVLTPSMELNKFVVTNGGKGYLDPFVILVPYFKTIFPDAGDQRAPLFNLLTTAISKATKTQVIADAPVMS